MAGNLIFSFYELSERDQSVAKARRYFAQAGAAVTSVDIDTRIQRAFGTSFREIQFGFADSQSVALGIKKTGDVYQVKVNGRVMPLKAQDDHLKAIVELVGMMNAGRTRFQAALAKTKVVLPNSIRTAAPRIEEFLRGKSASLDEAIVLAREKLADLSAANA